MSYFTRDVTEVVRVLGYIFCGYFTHNRCLSSSKLVHPRLSSSKEMRFSFTSWSLKRPFCYAGKHWGNE